MDLQERCPANNDQGDYEPDDFLDDNGAFGLGEDDPGTDTLFSDIVPPNNPPTASQEQRTPSPGNSDQLQNVSTLNEPRSTDNQTSDLSSPPRLSSNHPEYSPLPRRPPVPFGHADEPFVGRGHGQKIRAYSPTLREAGSSEFDGGDDDADDDDADDDDADDGGEYEE